MSSTGASKLRSITTASCESIASAIVFACPSFRSELLHVLVHPFEAGLPHRSVPLGPRRDVLERRGVEDARPVLGALTAHDQAGALQHLEVLRDRGKRERERFGELVHR